MNYEKEFQPFLNFDVKHQGDDFSIVVLFHTPDECPCGTPHGTLFLHTGDDQIIQLCDFSMETKQSFANFVSSVDALFGMNLLDSILEGVQSQKKSLVESE